MEKKNTGYKAMLTDRCPKLVSIALKWCKAKSKWVDYVYKTYVNIYTEKQLRHEAVRIVLGLSKKDRQFDFNKTIEWDNLNEEETNYWNYVKGWVEWFTKNHICIEQDYHLYGEEYTINRWLCTLDEATKTKLWNVLLTSFGNNSNKYEQCIFQLLIEQSLIQTRSLKII